MYVSCVEEGTSHITFFPDDLITYKNCVHATGTWVTNGRNHNVSQINSSQRITNKVLVNTAQLPPGDHGQSIFKYNAGSFAHDCRTTNVAPVSSCSVTPVQKKHALVSVVRDFILAVIQRSWVAARLVATLPKGVRFLIVVIGIWFVAFPNNMRFVVTLFCRGLFTCIAIEARSGCTVCCLSRGTI